MRLKRKQEREGIIKWSVETAGLALTHCGQQRAEADSLFVQPRSFGESLALELFPHVIQLDRLKKVGMETERKHTAGPSPILDNVN